MAIHVSRKRIGSYPYEKSLSVKKLKEILNCLSEDNLIYPNQVRNLTIKANGVTIGYIDFAEEKEIFFKNLTGEEE